MEKTKNIVERSRSGGFPTLNLEESVNVIKKGSTGGWEMSKDTFAKAIGGTTANSGAFIVKLGTLRDYGFVERGGRVVYTQLAKEIVAPKSDSAEEFQNKLKEAFLSCSVFSSLFDKIKNGSGESTSSTIENLGVHDYKIAVNRKKLFAENFVSSAKYAGLMEDSTDGKIKITKGEPVNHTPLEENPSSPAFTQNKGGYPFNDSGKGWSLSIKSEKPLSSKLRKILVDIAEILESEVNN
jgi:hypothetical protein